MFHTVRVSGSFYNGWAYWCFSCFLRDDMHCIDYSRFDIRLMATEKPFRSLFISLMSCLIIWSCSTSICG